MINSKEIVSKIRMPKNFTVTTLVLPDAYSTIRFTFDSNITNPDGQALGASIDIAKDAQEDEFVFLFKAAATGMMDALLKEFKYEA